MTLQTDVLTDGQPEVSQYPRFFSEKRGDKKIIIIIMIMLKYLVSF